MAAYTIAARTHGRYLIDRPTGDGPQPLVVGFHGYGERAEDMLQALQRIRGDRAWLLVSVQALNRFYTRSQDIVASWMTREDRELAIADNIEYVASVIGTVRRDEPSATALFYVGFSQGAAMAYRAAAFAAADGRDVPSPSGAIVLAGDVPPDVAPQAAELPPVLIGRGTADDWYTEAKATADLEVFKRAGVTPRVHLFDGGHLWDESFVVAARAFVDRCLSR
jgi:predicted esterase